MFKFDRVWLGWLIGALQLMITYAFAEYLQWYGAFALGLVVGGLLTYIERKVR